MLEQRGASFIEHGVGHPGRVFWNTDVPILYEESVKRDEALITPGGGLAVTTGARTGRSPNDKFIVREPSSESDVWWGTVNRPWTTEGFDALRRRIQTYCEGRDLFVQDVSVGADPTYRLPIRVISESAWAALFARNMFLPPAKSDVPPFTILHAPGFRSIPVIDGTSSEVAIVISFEQRLALIAGTAYAGEIKKAVFTILNYLMPKQDVLSMHCGANASASGDVALFFGLSGTGKTTLSSDSDRLLIGDDEHGWSADGIFNFEGGCYAKIIRLSPVAEPEIYRAIHCFGTILENVVVDPRTRCLDLDADTITENTRASYPLSSIPGSLPSGQAGHPSDVVLLTADAFGIMPPIARLTAEQTLYHFISGYTAKVAGTEAGLGSEPEATFSACFGAPFMVHHPAVYARLLGERIRRHDVRCWLINTGWTGGPSGVGRRVSIAHTRAIVRAALKGQLDNVSYHVDPIFRLRVPEVCPGVPPEILRPRDTWPDPAAYDAQAVSLARRFVANFEEFASRVPEDVKFGGPKLD